MKLIRKFYTIIKYMISSGVCFLVDEGGFLLVAYLLGKYALSMEDSTVLLFATVTSRITSSLLNYYINKNVVFQNKDGVGATFVKYYILCICQLFACYKLLDILATKIFNADTAIMQTALKIGVDCFLFLISYQVQKRWVFKNKKKENENGK